MFHNWTNNSKINRLHERCLQLIYNDKKSFFEDVLEKEEAVTIYHRNLRALVVYLLEELVLCKTAKSIQYEELLICRYVSCQISQLWISLSYIGSKLWESIPSHMKGIDSVNEFKHVIEIWKPDLCSCRLCKVYL